MSAKNSFFLAIFSLLFLALSACSGGGGGNSTPPPDDTTNPPVTISKSTFTGIIRQSSGNPLPGVTITLEGTSQTATTDANGIFALPETLSGDYVIDIDGTTATGDSGTSFGTLKIAATVGTEETTSLNQVIILPDLSNPLTASISVTGEAGNIVGGIVAENGTILLGSNGADVLMQIDGSNVQGSINVSATPVPLADLPMALPASAGANAGSFVTIQPPTATFNPALDLTIPNDQGLAPGTLVDIYSFDHDLNDWVNRSAEFDPPHQGVVNGDGTLIEAIEVISKGGWNGPLVPAAYIETVIGFVMNGDIPLQGVLVFTSTGQQGITGADGSFSILVPVPGISIDVSITATSNGANGGVSTTTPDLPTADDGIPLDFGVIDLALPTTGIVSGVALQTGSPSTQPVTISGDTFTQILTPDANGAFTLSGLPAGAYTASSIFAGDTQATTTSFNIVTGLITVITLQNSLGDSIVVQVSLLGENFNNPVIANDSDRQVTVTLSQGSTAITQTTNEDGRATFNNITGAVTITGQIDFQATQNNTIRIATSIHDITPVNGQIGLPLLIPDLSPSTTPIANTAITGVISNIPPLPANSELLVIAKEENNPDCCDSLNVSTFIPTDSITNGTVEYTLDDFSGIGVGRYTVMAIISRFDLTTLSTVYDLAAIHPAKVTTTAGESTTNVNLNFTDTNMRLEFTTRDIAINNLILPAPEPDTNFGTLSLANTVLLASSEELIFEIRFSLLNTTPTPPTGSFITSAPGGTRVSYDLETLVFENTETTLERITAQSASLINTDATTATFNLIDSPVISSPTNRQILSLASANNMTASWTDTGSTDLVFAVINDFDFASATDSIGALFWAHYLPGSSTSLTIPSASADTLAMFTTDTVYQLQIETARSDSVFNYNQLFDFNVGTNITDILFSGNNESSSTTGTFVTAP